jgi:hypothetical protein
MFAALACYDSGRSSVDSLTIDVTDLEKLHFASLDQLAEL